MLICPHCQFENPDDNKFCQSCGTSLEHKICHNCAEHIPLQAEKCEYCGASVQTVFWGIISQEQPKKRQKSSAEKIQLVSSESATYQANTVKTLDYAVQYLDPDQRYYLDDQESNPLEPIETSSSTDELFQGRVIDLYPLRKPYLATIREEQAELFGELEQDLNNSYLHVAQYWNLIGIPTHALPYLMMQKFTSVLPEVYDAWQYEHQGVVLLSDRSSWNLLTDIWSSHNAPFIQILWSLDEILKLWNPLAKINCTKSLLVKHNLRIDEDESFCLQQLYLDSADVKPTLIDLAHKWQLWLGESGIINHEKLNNLLTRTIEGEIQTVEELSERLHQIEPEISNIDFNQTTNDSENLDLYSVKSTEDESEEFEDFAFFVDDDNQENITYDSETEDQPTMVLPMELASMVDAGYTDIGVQRDHNEDFFGIQSRIFKQENGLKKTISAKGLYIVCDGMGGHAAGEVASSMAVETLQQYFKTHWQKAIPNEEIIQEGVLLANQTLYQTNLDDSRSGSGRMGTTLVMALLEDTKLIIAHVGDSRIYRVTRQRGLEQLTLDHEVGQREITRGVEPEIAYGRPDAYQLTQALGPRDSSYVRPEIQTLDLKEDSLILLCSDGLCDNDLLESHWQTYLTPLISSSANLEEGLLQLIDFANQYNGHDNITGILIRIKLKATL
ncbi:MAG: serine/threonine phosphatase [Xenococcaceae cyanobacterium MO_188.B29]|nr:serine/threonine phosphatase [Xenococcaceae cyanobacterium MO_188.B29]